MEWSHLLRGGVGVGVSWSSPQALKHKPVHANVTPPPKKKMSTRNMKKLDKTRDPSSSMSSIYFPDLFIDCF